MSNPVIAIDAMGGDFGPRCIVPASIACLAEFSHLRLILVGRSSELEALIAQEAGEVDRRRLQIEHASEVVAMDEPPAQALRGKPDSSMRVALGLIRSGRAHACVSAGNSGALMALSRHLLKTLPGVDRPAMISALPTVNGFCHLLDLGANVDCSPEQLFQFAVMGAVAAEALGVVRPRVALLNVGTENIKGNQQVRQTAALLQQAKGLNYIGFVEGDGVYRGDADVVVCDGFVGNILLKSSEGLVAMVSARIRTLLDENLGAKLAGLMAFPLLHRLHVDLAPATHNGASLLGLQGIVVKSHGAADEVAFQSAIRLALAEIHDNLPHTLHGRLKQWLH